MTAEFYLQTVDVVFQRHALPKGRMRHRGRKVDLGAITDVPILANEGERDDIAGVGQTKAALTLTPSLPAPMKHHPLAQGAGHLRFFNGPTWRSEHTPNIQEVLAPFAHVER